MPDENLEEKDHYSYEEMMDHLRRVHSRHGVKSKKKRRRRSHQPLKERRKRRFFLAAGLSIACVALAAAGINIFFSYSYYQSERFRVELGNQIEEATGFMAEFENRFLVNRFRFSNKLLRLKGDSGSIVHEANFRGLRGSVPPLSLLGTVWDVDLLVDEIEAVFRPISAASAASGGAAPENPASRILAAALGFERLPRSLIVKRLALQELTLDFGSDVRAMSTLREATLLFKRTPDGYFIDTKSGDLRFDYWPLLHLVGGSMAIDRQGRLEILESTWKTDSGGACALQGTAEFASDNPGLDLQVTLSNFQLNEFVHPFWRERLVGSVSGRLELKSGFREGDPYSLQGTLNGEGIAIKRIPVLDQLSVMAGLDLFQRMEAEEFTTRLEETRDHIRLYELSATAAGFFLLHGECTIHSDERLEGTFELGIPNTLLDRFVGGRPAFFEPRGDNVSWASFQLGGTLRKPEDTLIEKFRQHAGDPAAPAAQPAPAAEQ